MNKALPRFMIYIMVFVLTAGIYIPGRASPQATLMPSKTINIAHFYKPPQGMDAATTIKNFGTIILTNGDHTFRNQLVAGGFSSDIAQYFRTEGIQDPGSCTESPANNQVAYKKGDFCFISQNHPDWFLLDQSGRRITTSARSDYYRMDPANAGWKNFFLTRVLESQGQYGWTALFLDNVEGSLSNFYGDIRPAKYPSDSSYQAAVIGFLQYLDVNYSQKYNRPIMANITARNDEATWFNYLQYLDGAMQERFAVNWSVGDYISENKWKGDLVFAEKTQANGKYIILIAPGSKSDTNRQKFAFASYLLVSNGKAAFRYTTDDAYSQLWLYDNYNLDLGSPLGPRYQSGGSSWQRDFTKGYVIVDPVNRTATISVTTRTLANVFVGGAAIANGSGSFSNPSSSAQLVTYAGLSGGPVRVLSTNKVPIVTSLGLRYKNAAGKFTFSELMGVSTSQLSNDYWLPYYKMNATDTDTQVRFTNTSATESTTVSVYVGDNPTPLYTKLLPASSADRAFFPATSGGPVRIVGSNPNVKILAGMRVIYGGNMSFDELMAYPTAGLSSEYWFPFYNHNNVNLFSELRIANTSGTQSAQVQIYFGNRLVETKTIDPLTSHLQSFPGVSGGPVRVLSTNKVPIVTSLGLRYKNAAGQFTFSELMGVPTSQLSNDYWLPYYKMNATDTDTQVRFTNTSATESTTVSVYVGDNPTPLYTKLLPASSADRAFFPATSGGPVRIVGSNPNAKILAGMRVIYGGNMSFDELMAYPTAGLSSEYWFPFYNHNNVNLFSELRVGVP
jgi:hypothetical protein